MVRAVRGAVIVENTADSIREQVVALLREIMARNAIAEEELISVMFTQTDDVTALNPATALRTVGFASVPLFCSQEPHYEGSSPRVIRVLVTCESNEKMLKPVYLNGAEKLRVDLQGSHG